MGLGRGGRWAVNDSYANGSGRHRRIERHGGIEIHCYAQGGVRDQGRGQDGVTQGVDSGAHVRGDSDHLLDLTRGGRRRGSASMCLGGEL